MNKKGFTLIEILIVIIIVGILASLALPKLTRKIGEAKAAEATTNMGAFVRALDTCYQTATATTQCDELDELGISNPNTPGNRSFNYTLVYASGDVEARCVEGRCNGTITYPITCELSTADSPGCSIGTRAATGDFTGLVSRWN